MLAIEPSNGAGRVDPVPSSDRLMREPGSRYIDFLIPACWE